MRIILNNTKKTLVCTNCRSILEVEDSEITKEDRFLGYNGKGDIWSYDAMIIKECPCCNAKNVEVDYFNKDSYRQ